MICLLGIALVAGCGGGGGSSHTLTGSVHIPYALTLEDGPYFTCRSSPGSTPCPIVVEDAKGEVIAQGPLTYNDAESYSGPGPDPQTDGSYDAFAFTLAHVPDSGFYSVLAGPGTPSPVRYTRSDLQTSHWNITINLGG